MIITGVRQNTDVYLSTNKMYTIYIQGALKELERRLCLSTSGLFSSCEGLLLLVCEVLWSFADKENFLTSFPLFVPLSRAWDKLTGEKSFFNVDNF